MSEKSDNVSCSNNADTSHCSCYSCNTFSGKNQVQTSVSMKNSHFSVCRQLVQTPEKSANVSCSNNADTSHCSCYSCNTFPEKNQVQTSVSMKNSHFSVCRQLVQTPEKSANVSCSNNADTSHCSCYSCNTFPEKNQV